VHGGAHTYMYAPLCQALSLFWPTGVISPLLSSIYLHVLDVLWTRHSVPPGTLVRYAERSKVPSGDFVVMCHTRKACEQAEARIRVILERLGLERHWNVSMRLEHLVS
jgi:RNA-directed DNA polymerase